MDKFAMVIGYTVMVMGAAIIGVLLAWQMVEIYAEKIKLCKLYADIILSLKSMS